MAFTKVVPTWSAEGSEPPSSLKTSGFTAGYKPPAAYFNWYMHGTSEALAELQALLGNVDNTADSEKSVNYANSAGTAATATSATKATQDSAGQQINMTYIKGLSVSGRTVTYTKGDGTTGTITTQDTNTTYSAATPSAAGLMSAADKSKLDSVESRAGFTVPIVAATSSDGVTYTATIDGVTELTVGLMITFVPDTTSTSTSPTLNLNGLGAKTIRRRLSSGTATRTVGGIANFFYETWPTPLVYDGTYWVMLDRTKPAALDLYGYVPVTNGGTGLDSVTAGSFLVGNGTEDLVEKTPAEVLTLIGAAAATHYHAASQITAGRFAGAVMAATSGEDAATFLLRNSKLVSAETTPTVNGEICWTYE